VHFFELKPTFFVGRVPLQIQRDIALVIMTCMIRKIYYFLIFQGEICSSDPSGER
jgi:hypothetical protein